MNQEDARWQLVSERKADPTFVYAVRTTGIYCLAGCASRRPRRENVAFYESSGAAQRAGYRPCKRCEPDRVGAAESWIVAACRALESDPALTLQQLAEKTNMSPFYLQKRFKAAVGLTPKQYARAARRGLLAAELERGRGVTEALHSAGYGSSSQVVGELGMSPSDYRRGASGQRIRFAQRLCRLGCVLVAWTERGICAVELGDREAELSERLRARFPRAYLEIGDCSMVESVVRAVEGNPGGSDLPLDLLGTAFQRRVWHELQQIRSGSTLTYSELAERLQAPHGARAVAAACGANPLAVLVPCHRVVGKDGDLRGYRWGLDRKRALLERETPGYSPLPP